MPTIGSTPAVIVQHLGGNATLRQLLEVKTPHGARAAALDLRVEIPELISALRAEGLGDAADDLEFLADAVSERFRRQGRLVLPVRAERTGLLRLAILDRWQEDIHVCALLALDDVGIREQLPGGSEVDRLQTVLDEYRTKSSAASYAA